MCTRAGSFFCPAFEDVDDDRYIRFCECGPLAAPPGGAFSPGVQATADTRVLIPAVANVDSATLEKVPARLEALNAMWDSL